jgi:hypothetical protein
MPFLGAPQYGVAVLAGPAPLWNTFIFQDGLIGLIEGILLCCKLEYSQLLVLLPRVVAVSPLEVLEPALVVLQQAALFIGDHQVPK